MPRQTTIGSYFRASPGKSKKSVKVKSHKRRIIARKPIKNVRQTARGKAQDRSKKALPPGRRWNESRTRKYSERRSNRSD